jgi:hypothetical protein
MADSIDPDALGEIRTRHRMAITGPWYAYDSEDSWSLHAGALQILKAPKHSTPYAEYWPEPTEAALLEHAHADIGALLAEIDRLAELVANKDESTSELFAANLDLREEVARLRAELVGRDRMWSYRHTAANGPGGHIGIPMSETDARKRVAVLQAKNGAAGVYEVVCYDYTDWRTEDEANRAMGIATVDINHDGDQS